MPIVGNVKGVEGCADPVRPMNKRAHEYRKTRVVRDPKAMISDDVKAMLADLNAELKPQGWQVCFRKFAGKV